MNCSRQNSSLIACLLAALLLPAASFAENPFATWFHQYDPSIGSSPSANATAIDKSGFVAVAGFTWTGSGRKIFYVALHDPFTGQYAPGWPRTYDSGFGPSEANDVVFDSAGNIIVTGSSHLAAGIDYYTRKYNRLGGTVWSMPYDRAGGADEARHVAVDSANNVIVTGQSSDSVSGPDIYTVKYRAFDGEVLSELRYNNGGNRPDSPTGLVIDSEDKVIVCGVTRSFAFSDDFYLAKYDMSTLVATAVWTRTIDNPGFDTAHDVAVDAGNNVVVVGLLRTIGNEHGFFARKYNAAGGIEWSQPFPDVDGAFLEGARSVAVDADGNAFVTGVHEADNSNTTFYTAKLLADSGAIDWFRRAPLFDGIDVSVDDPTPPIPLRIALDPAGNPIVAGSARFRNASSDFYIGKYSSNNNGATLWERIYEGAFPNGGTDRVRDMAVDPFGNIAIAGDALRQAGNLNEIITFKIGATVLATGDPISGPGIPAGAKISQISPPATANSGGLAARIGIKAGRKKLGAIVSLVPGKGLQFPAVQGAAAPGLTDATFKTFLDPVVAPNGEIAFVAKVAGVKSSEAMGVWTNAFSANGGLELALQQGKQVPGLAAGTLLKSITSLSHRNNQLLALIKVAGAAGGVNSSNAVVLYRVTGIGTGVSLVRAGDPLTVDAVESTIKKITVFTPPKDSAGHGRYHGDIRSVARVVLADKRTAVVAVTSAGAQTIVTHTAKDASSMVTGALWSTVSLPAIDGTGARYAALGTLAIGEGSVTKANDSIIGFLVQGGNFTKVAREGEDAPGISGAKFSKLQDPITSASRVAFLGTVAGSGVSSKNRSGLWFGPAAAVSLLARTNDPNFPATDGAANSIDARWTSFKSIALPNGTGEGPLFIATIAGPAGKGTGLWALDSEGFVRKVIRVGDKLGDLTVKKFTVLTPVAGSIGATRSFSPTRSVALLVTFSNKTTGILNIAVP